MKTSRYIKASDWVAIAEQIAAKHGGILPNPQTLINGGYWALYQQMRRNPRLFGHIRQQKLIGGRQESAIAHKRSSRKQLPASLRVQKSQGTSARKPVEAPQIRTMTRLEWAAFAEGRGRRFSLESLRKVLETEHLNGWVTVLPVVGPPAGKVPLIHASQRLARLVCQCRNGSSRFTVESIERATGAKITSLQAGRLLARVGLAIAGWDGEEVDLLAADPDEARIVNGTRRKRAFVETSPAVAVAAILGAHGPHRQPVRLTQERRMQAWEAWLERWEIRADSLLGENQKVRLVSEWHLTMPERGTAAKREVAHAR